MPEKASVIIYRDRLLPYSETFVRDQGEGLRRFTPYYVGSRWVEGLPLPIERTLVENRTRRALYGLWGAVPELHRRVRGLNPVLIHAHFGPDGVSALPLARDLRLPLLVTFHGVDATLKDEYARYSLRGRYRRHRAYLRNRQTLQREARLFIAVSEFIRGRLLEQGFPPEKTVVHYNGVDTEAFRPDPTVPREPVVLFVGRLIEKKGCEYLIRAMARVQKAMPDAELVVIGTGQLRASLERLAGKTLRRYRFLGVQPPENVRAWMNRAKVLSVPSITARSGNSEGFGLVFAEAQAAGLPVATFDNGPIPEVVAHGETGFLADERDWEALAGYIMRLVEDEALWGRFSRSGRERVRAAFDLNNQTRVLEEMYAAVLRQGE